VGTILSELAAAAKDAETVTPYQTASDGGSHPKVIALTFTGPSGRRAFVLNLDASEIVIDASAIVSGCARVASVSASDPAAKIGDSASLVRAAYQTDARSVRLAGFSAVHVSAP
jgi:hypothetical protein